MAHWQAGILSTDTMLCKAPNADLGYPASAQLDDGTIITVYYQCPQAGQKTVIMTTRWGLEHLGAC